MKLPSRKFVFTVVLPTLLIASFGLFIVALSQSLAAKDVTRRESEITSRVASRFKSRIDAEIRVLNGVRALWLSSEEVTKEEFANFASLVFEDDGALVSLQWVDPGNVVRYVYPLEGENLKVVDFDNNKFPNRLKPILEAKEIRSPVMTRPIFLAQGYPGFVLYMPIFRGDEYLGAAVGVMRLDTFISSFQLIGVPDDYDILVTVDDIVFGTDADALYTLDGKRIISPAGDAVPDPAAPRISPDHERDAAQLYIAEQPFLVHAGYRGTSTSPLIIALVAIAFAVTALCASFLNALYRTSDTLERTVARERDFASLVSHQLRAPLTEVNWMMDVIEDPDTGANERTKAIADMRRIVRQSVRTITELLSISRIERGLLQIKTEETAIATVVDDAVAPLREAAKARALTFRLDVPASLTADVDAAKAVEALRNIVDNAIKYGPAGSSIDIDAERENGTVRISIRDRGPGIPEDVKNDIFDKASAFTKKGTTDGAGLGLYLSKMLIELMNGTIRFETSPKGTVFIVTLPTTKRGGR